MDEQLKQTYDTLANGLGASLEIQGKEHDLLHACFAEGGREEPERRLGALKVVAHLPPRDQMRIADPLMHDADLEVRRLALALALAAKGEGLSALRGAVNSHDTELALEALSHLVTQLDVACTLHARQWVRHGDPRVRAGAARLLGNISGPAMAVVLGRVAEADPVPAVRLIAAEAARRCSGEEPKEAPRDHWVAGPADLTLPEALVQKPIRIPQEASGLATLYPEDLEREEPEIVDADVEMVEPEPTGQLMPSAPEGSEEVVQETPRDWREPAPLPATMPTSPTAIIRLMGMVSPDDRIHVLTALLAVSKEQRANALSTWGPGADPVTGRGTAIALAMLEDDRHSSMLRHMLSDAHPGVRSGAAEALGATGTLSMIPPLSSCLAAPEPEVRLAAVEGLSSMLMRRERFAMLRDRIEPLAEDPDMQVRKAVENALAALP